MPAPEVTTSLGSLRGLAQAGVDQFFGIPYAAPPLGALRFEPPQACEAWRGVREATAFGAAPIQPVDGLSQQLGLLGQHAQAEDCLSLNVFRPAALSHALRPVMVWLHGGAFQTGTAAGPAYSGAPLALRGDLIVVTLNYRVGALGFLHLGGARTNLGLQDQLAALRFVQREIAAFGGDPASVTVFGESAGAGSICALLAMPAARGLFRRAIVQSAAPDGILSAGEAAERAKLLCEKLGGAASDLAWLRSLSADEILAAQSQAAEPGPRRIGMYFAPVVDGDVLPELPREAIARGAARDVELVIGTTADEMQLFTLVPGFGEMPEAALPFLVASRLGGPEATRGERAVRLVAAYSGATPLERFFALETDASLFVPSTRLAEAHARHQPRTFMYRFSWRSALAGGRLGACHALDVPFALGTLGLPKIAEFAGSGAAAQRVSAAMMDAWVAFARSGDPGWPAYAAPRRATFVIDDPCRVEDAPHEKERALWSELTEASA